MNLFEILISFGNFLLLFFLHMIIKKKPIQSEDKLLLTVWILMPIIILIIEYNIFKGNIYLIVYLTFIISFSWIVSYPAIYAASPTLIILLLIKYGVNDVKEIKKIFDIKENSSLRISDAVKFGFIKSGDNGILKLTPFGWIFIKVMLFFKLVHLLKYVKSV